MKISFDFDFTLSEKTIQDIAESYIKMGNDVYITTTRFRWSQDDDYKNKDLYSIARKLNIDQSKIRFTNGDAKYKYLEDFDIHYDDDLIEIELIRENISCKTILVYEDNQFNVNIKEID